MLLSQSGEEGRRVVEEGQLWKAPAKVQSQCSEV